MVRSLTEYEQKWNFWTTSTAFYPNTPKTRGLVQVPVGECWVIERNGTFLKTLEHGTFFLVPFLDTIKKVKVTTLCSMGIMSRGIETKNGLVDAYVVVDFIITNPSLVILYSL
jgi:regulator of protease activity HflC (stomatin/prohibitin superfamily)